MSKKYYCWNCNKYYSHVIKETVSYEQYYGVSDLFSNHHNGVKVCKCPICKNEVEER